MTERAWRRRVAAVAGHEGEVDSARRLLSDADASVRGVALGALLRAVALRRTDLEAAAGDTDPTVRRRAAEVTAAAPAAARISVLGLLDDPDPRVVETAAWASGEIDPPEPEVVATLSRLAEGHEDALVREAAVAALGAIGDEAGLPAILAATRDKPTVRRRAVIALAPFDGPAVDEALERARTDRDWQVRQAAEDLLGSRRVSGG
ncbi:MAG: HEAT repeat domain-containing protein [Acidimicrobiales bacterium]